MKNAIEKFGDTVEKAASTSPQRALTLLKAGYKLSSLYMKVSPNKSLLPHQRYISEMNNYFVRQALAKPENTGLVNLFFPSQLLHAFEVTPQFTEGVACYLNGAGSDGFFINFAEKAGIPTTYCSYHKTMLGAFLANIMPSPLFVASTSLACDANICTFRAIAEHCQVPHFFIDVPQLYSKEATRYVVDQLKEVTKGIEKATGKKLDEEKLKEAIARENRSIKLYQEYYRLLAYKYLPNNIASEMNKIFPTHVFMGTQEAEKYFSMMLQDIRSAPASKGEKRILWAHVIPLFQESIRDLLDQNNHLQLLASDINFDYMEELNEDKPYQALAKKLLLNSFNGPQERRTAALIEMAKKLNADGVIYFCHWGCKQNLGSAELIREDLEKEGFPVLLLEGDGCDINNSNEGQMNTRLQAFLEMLEVSS